MKLTALKSKLQVIAGTNIGQVFFDWKSFLNVTRTKTYPCVLWSLDNAKFIKDTRTSTVQKVKEFTITVFAIARFDPNTMDKIDEWDTLEGYFDVYLNSIDAEGSLQIMNISSLRGEYIPEGIISADKEIGIMFTDVVIKMFC